MNSFREDVVKYANGQALLTLPILTAEFVADLFARVQVIFASEPTLLAISSPCLVVGDIHGQVLDLCRILNTFGLPPQRRYLFLGDIVDRGEFSVECLVIVYLLKALWPDDVYIIRGNHEFTFLCSQCGFMAQLVDAYADFTVYVAAISSFTQIPLAAVIDSTVFCVHGGIGPDTTTLDDIRSISRPIEEFGTQRIDSLVWNDPSDVIDMFSPSQTRGTGFSFGAKAVATFLAQTHLELIIRAHEFVESGYEWRFDGSLITVFSASNYCGLIGNQGAVVEIGQNAKYSVRQFAPLPWLLRKKVTFRPFEKSFLKQKPCRVELGPSLMKLKMLGSPTPSLAPKTWSPATSSLSALPSLMDLNQGGDASPGPFHSATDSDFGQALRRDRTGLRKPTRLARTSFG
jgi:protein phosphatase